MSTTAASMNGSPAPGPDSPEVVARLAWEAITDPRFDYFRVLGHRGLMHLEPIFKSIVYGETPDEVKAAIREADGARDEGRAKALRRAEKRRRAVEALQFRPDCLAAFLAAEPADGAEAGPERTRASGPIRYVLPDPGAMPAELQQLRRSWALTLLKRGRDGKVDKPPYHVLLNEHASVTEPRTLADYGAVQAAIERWPDKPLLPALAVTGDGRRTVIDLDDCLESVRPFDPDSDEDEPIADDDAIPVEVPYSDGTTEPKAVRRWARRIVHALNTRTEVSTTGTGLRLVVRGLVPRRITKVGNFNGDGSGSVEFFTDGHFATFTGRALDGFGTIRDAHEELTALFNEVVPEDRRRPDDASEVVIDPDGFPERTDDEVVELARTARSYLLCGPDRHREHVERFAKLWKGDDSDYPSGSDADWAFHHEIARYAGPRPDQVERIASGSPRATARGHKWADHRRGKSFLRYDIDRCIASKTPGDYWLGPWAMRATGQAAGAESRADGEAPRGEAKALDYDSMSDADLGIVRGASVRPKPIRWHWKYRAARGKLTMIAGDGGKGKTTIGLWMCAASTREWEFPDGSGRAPLGTAVILSAEDNPEDTLAPRLIAMGADMDRIVFQRARATIRRPNKAPLVHPCSLQDLSYWNAVFNRIDDCCLFFVDSLPGYLGRGVNDSKNNEVRAVVEPFLSEIIEPRGAAMVTVTHLNKSVDAATPAHRILGSVAYVNLPRNVHVVVPDPDDPKRRIFKQVKCNNADEELPALAFRVEVRHIQSDEGEDIECTAPVFEPQPINVDIGAAMGRKRGPEPAKTDGAARWLVDQLRGQIGGVRLSAIIQAAGEARHIGKQKPDGKWSNLTALYRARDMVSGLDGDHAGWEVEESTHPNERGYAVKFWRLSALDGSDPPF